MKADEMLLKKLILKVFSPYKYALDYRSAKLKYFVVHICIKLNYTDMYENGIYSGYNCSKLAKDFLSSLFKCVNEYGVELYCVTHIDDNLFIDNFIENIHIEARNVLLDEVIEIL